MDGFISPAPHPDPAPHRQAELRWVIRGFIIISIIIIMTQLCVHSEGEGWREGGGHTLRAVFVLSLSVPSLRFSLLFPAQVFLKSCVTHESECVGE